MPPNRNVHGIFINLCFSIIYEVAPFYYHKLWFLSYAAFTVRFLSLLHWMGIYLPDDRLGKSLNNDSLNPFLVDNKIVW